MHFGSVSWAAGTFNLIRLEVGIFIFVCVRCAVINIWLILISHFFAIKQWVYLVIGQLDGACDRRENGKIRLEKKSHSPLWYTCNAYGWHMLWIRSHLQNPAIIISNMDYDVDRFSMGHVHFITFMSYFLSLLFPPFLPPFFSHTLG